MDIDLEGLARFITLLVGQEALPVWSHVKRVEAVRPKHRAKSGHSKERVARLADFTAASTHFF
jgi:hypothetical protein